MSTSRLPPIAGEGGREGWGKVRSEGHLVGWNLFMGVRMRRQWHRSDQREELVILPFPGAAAGFPKEVRRHK